MDKSWMYQSRLTSEYLNGVEGFLNFAFQNASIDGKIVCPCVKCGNGRWVMRSEAVDHLVCDGFIKGYTKWIAHGEALSSTTTAPIAANSGNALGTNNSMREMLHDTFGISNRDVGMDDMPSNVELSNADAKKFFKLVSDAQKPLYPGCKEFSKLSLLVELFHNKCLGKWTNDSFTRLLRTFNRALPEGEKLPNSYYEAKKVLGELGLSYKKIHACPNDCMLYWKEHIDDTECHVCHEQRYKTVDNHEGAEGTSAKKCKKVPRKVLRHFPLIPRLQRLFMSSKIASFMKWHDEGRTKDGCMRHPADSPAWQTFDFKHKEFAKDSRNVRLGLASDGFNPFGMMSNVHSTWPVILMPYNLPPWMCMKQPYFIMSLLIPGRSAPGNNIDVYLQPLIEELKELWGVGVDTLDASTNQNFKMHAALMWTINDFPAYANLSGWSTKGRLACPSCHKDTCSSWLKYSGKHIYMDHRRFLEDSHKFRRDKRSFNGKEERRKAPCRLTGSMIQDQLKGVQFKFGKLVKDNPKLPFNWKKPSIFFELPYWKDNLLRHNLDVMHIEKNVCDSVLATLLNLIGKSKDHWKARQDLKDMGFRSELHPIEDESGRTYLPAACFSMTKKEKDIFYKVLQNVKVPDGYASNISRSFQNKEHKVSGMKSHDNHILMQQLLPLALRRVLPKQVRSPLIKLCNFFRELCSKVLHARDLIRLEKQIAITLCELERIFPPSFFDIMMHLPIHLATEAKLAGPVHYRWMYPIERYLATLKSYVRNKNRPEGSIAEGYLAEECLTFCSRYLEDVETRFNRVGRNDDEGSTVAARLPIFATQGRPFGKVVTETLDQETLVKAHQYVLFNCDAVDKFSNQHQTMTRDQNPRLHLWEIQRMHNEKFASWFGNHVQDLQLAEDEQLSEELRALARGPDDVGKRYTGYLINGFRFHTREVERRRKFQNSGVVVTATTTSFSSASDNNPVAGDIAYYGVLTDVIELSYFGGRKVVLFKCDWMSEGKNRRPDEHGFTLVNFARLVHVNEPFVLASQVQQAFYVEDPLDKGWHVVIRTTARDAFNMNTESCIDDVETYLQSESCDGQLQDDQGDISLVREDVQGTTVDTIDATTAQVVEDDGVEGI
ncbi:hypothetical protein RHSIM_Rhsim06G0085100 [Rhododendron simsii]|uniref:Transposase n=1 Tax=Rhododendron simsii TaxID=118357 RepID=A0A834LK93_RHOSS|nr:hypothetical protein RHSIM_Rhsim06G0085100 [Rhododendron simsii]